MRRESDLALHAAAFEAGSLSLHGEACHFGEVGMSEYVMCTISYDLSNGA